MQDTEIFKPIKGYEGVYEVSNLGRIKSLERIIMRPTKIKERILKPKNKGYCEVALSLQNRDLEYLTIHRLVALAFIPNPENKPFVNHKNGVKTDNRVENLEWVMPSENQLHAHANGLNHSIKGEENYNCKLSEEKVIEIFKSNKTQKVLAQQYGVSQSAINLIKTGTNWRHITKDL